MLLSELKAVIWNTCPSGSIDKAKAKSWETKERRGTETKIKGHVKKT